MRKQIFSPCIGNIMRNGPKLYTFLASFTYKFVILSLFCKGVKVVSTRKG